MNDALQRLSAWYIAHCDDEWEHQYGVMIDTLDNPGWSIKVDLQGTELAAREFRAVKIERSDHDWLQCRVANHMFEGFGGPMNLSELIEVFLGWADGGRAQ
jgi:Immunity protein 53